MLFIPPALVAAQQSLGLELLGWLGAKAGLVDFRLLEVCERSRKRTFQQEIDAKLYAVRIAEEAAGLAILGPGLAIPKTSALVSNNVPCFLGQGPAEWQPVEHAAKVGSDK
jgi:hypothetical protein